MRAAGPIVCAPDKLRGSLTAAEAASAIAAGARAAGFAAIEQPLADGGEGTRALLAAAGGRTWHVDSVDAVGRPVSVPVSVLPDGSAVVEAAEAIGLAALPAELLDPLRASSAGLAGPLRAVLDAGAARVVVCLGGTATMDGGLGLLTALGADARDGDGRSLRGGGADLIRLARLDLATLDPRLGRTELVGAVDVASPLTGPDGAAAVFGPQKGATPAGVTALDAALGRLGILLGPAAAVAGAGSAGGLGAALAAVGATLTPGGELVIDATGLRARLRAASLCLTAEGRVDGSSAAGKTVARVVAAAVEAGVRCAVIGGSLGDGWERLCALGADAVVAAARPGELATPADLCHVAQALCLRLGSPAAAQ
jgi:glycerate kinase